MAAKSNCAVPRVEAPEMRKGAPRKVGSSIKHIRHEIIAEEEPLEGQGILHKAWAKLQTLRDQVQRLWKSEEEDADQTPRGSFEEQFAKDSVKFEVGYVFISVLITIIYMTSNQGRPWPIDGINLWPAGVVSVAVRLVALLSRPFICKSCTIWVQGFCFIIDGLLLASCHPRVSTDLWFKQTPPVQPDVHSWQLDLSDVYNISYEMAINFTDQTNAIFHHYKTLYQEWEVEDKIFDGMMSEEYTIAHYQLNILIWYHIVFMLSFKRALILVPLVVSFYLSNGFLQWAHIGNQSDDLEPGCLESSLLFFNATVAVACKAKLEKAQRLEFKIAEEKRREVIKERVLRYEAEFAKERVGTSSVVWKQRPGPPSVAPSQITSTTSCTASTALSRAAASIRSAPAALHCGAVMSQMRRSGECLPPDAVVWVEGQALPRPVCSVARGDKVLCFDSLSLAPKFVEVLASETLVGTAAWVTVSLADGSTLTLTADHPTQPRRSEELPISTPVAAADLKAGSDSLMVLKMQPTVVKSVVPVPPKDPAGRGGVDRRVALTLQQPERHEVFVAPAGNCLGPELSTIAVGSADIAAPSASQAAGMQAACNKAFGLTVKRTFIDLDNGPKPYTRCSSCPPRVNKEEAGRSSARKQRSGGGSSKAGVTWAPSTVGPSETDGYCPPRLRRIASDSDVTSQSSRQSSTPTDVDVLVAVTGGASVATVGEMLQIRRSGFPSRGSAGHEHGNCQVCFFENRHQHGEGPPCFKGVLCERCHECHEPMSRKKRVPGPTRNVRKWQARLAQMGDAADGGKLE